MARPLRLTYPGACYYVTARAQEGELLFADSQDGERFVELIGEACSRYGWRIFGYCLIPGSYHLLVQTLKPTLTRGMRHIGGGFTQEVNRRRQRSGPLFRTRYRAILFEKDVYLGPLLSYLAHEPVHLGLCPAAEQWRWGSARFFDDTNGAHKPPVWLATDVIEHAHSNFADQAPPDARTLFANVYNQSILGTEHFVRQTINDTAGTAAAIAAGERPAQTSPSDERRSLAWFADAHAQRDSAMAEAYLKGHYTLRQIAAHFDVHISTVSRAVKRTEREARSQTIR